jgi:hypothetical protein
MVRYHRFSGQLISWESYKLSQGDLLKSFSHGNVSFPFRRIWLVNLVNFVPLFTKHFIIGFNMPGIKEGHNQLKDLTCISISKKPAVLITP